MSEQQIDAILAAMEDEQIDEDVHNGLVEAGLL